MRNFKTSVQAVRGVALGMLAVVGTSITHALPRQHATPHVQPTTLPVAQLRAPFVSTPSNTAATHIVVGHSIFVDTMHRLTRIYVTNPDVLFAYTASPNQLLITAKQPGLSSLILWDETGASQSYLFSSDVEIDALRSSLQQAMPNENVHVDGSQGRVLLTGTTSTQAMSDAAEKMASLYTKTVSNALVVNSSIIKQVRLKVRIVEVDRSKLTQFGFNFFSAGGNTLAQTSTTQFSSMLTTSTMGSSSGSGGNNSSSVGNKTVSITNPLNFLLYSSKLNVGMMLQDLQTKNVLQILAEPNITAMSGEKANFLAGGEFPFPVVQGAIGGLTSVSIQFRPYGVKLDFTPVVNSDGSIQLKVAPEVSALDFSNAVQISGYTIPALSTRRAETQVVLKDGQTFAISGLLDNRTSDQLERTPGIASIPILGALFKSKSYNHSTSELIVLVTPEIVDPNKTEVAAEPKPVIAPLDTQKFDAELPEKKEK